MVGAEIPPRTAWAKVQGRTRDAPSLEGTGKILCGRERGGYFPADFSRAFRNGSLDFGPQCAGGELPRAAQVFLAAIKARFFRISPDRPCGVQWVPAVIGILPRAGDRAVMRKDKHFVIVQRWFQRRGSDKKQK